MPVMETASRVREAVFSCNFHEVPRFFYDFFTASVLDLESKLDMANVKETVFLRWSIGGLT